MHWEDWENQLPSINSIAIPRWNHFEPQAEVIELNVFANASKLAFGIAVHLRIVQNDEVSVNLQVAKSKFVPLENGETFN